MICRLSKKLIPMVEKPLQEAVSADILLFFFFSHAHSQSHTEHLINLGMEQWKCFPDELCKYDLIPWETLNGFNHNRICRGVCARLQ